MSTTTRNRLESRYGGIDLVGEPHALSAWFVVALRAVMGGMMLFAGLGKFAFVSGEAFDASGFLVQGVDPASPVSGLYAAMAGNAMLLEVINVVVPVTQVLIGVALIAGAFVRLAALGGAIQMSMFYLGGWEGAWLAAFDYTLIYAVVFLAIAAFGAGRILGLDRYIMRIQVGGEALVERFPKLRYVLS
ncbi:DoxX family protein [Natronococcus amylolyticus DSM 10524]|uniref:DoxX family protein n=1 Tax=Natronococcus amylolyticus DSM 10524 TaxID=1227497 RepID=L9WY35_9EURY|nr:DoxX family protein [Natronococcus amylolyticus]ELY54379.1 DoxX family protein [Natronococcus amylolyticus DSM 10524]